MKVLGGLIVLLALPAMVSAADRPNIIVIITDDLGFGDVGCYGSTAIPTPHIDRMCAEGLKMTRCYATASTCTPTRYSMLTGEYAFRQPPRRTSILDGDAPLAIAETQTTVPSVLRAAGYSTHLVGKWHLGIGDGQKPVDFNGYVGPGPLEVGFDHAFYIPATVDRVPCVFIEDHAVHNLDPSDPLEISYKTPIRDEPIARERPDLLKYKGDDQHSDTIINGIGRIGYMKGGKSARWIDEDITDVLVERARATIEAEHDRPFFLLLGTHDPHKPHLPHPRFADKSACGRRGDSIVQTDWLVGQIMQSLKEQGLDDNTLVFFTSDNGPAIHDGYFDGAFDTLGDHKPAGPFRGVKYTVYEGGCRVPGIVRWPGRLEPSETDALFALIDLGPTLATIAGVDSLPSGGFPDAVDQAAVLLGERRDSIRKSLVLQGLGQARAIVSERWKYMPATHAGKPRQKFESPAVEMRFADLPIYEHSLFDIAAEPYESKNVIEEHADVANQLKEELQRVIGQN
jgi:arylsulfatase A-like enzyme